MGTRIPISVRADTLQDNSEVRMDTLISNLWLLPLGGFLGGAMIIVPVQLVLHRARRNRLKLEGAEHVTREVEHKKRERKKLRDRQNNLGRRVYNLISNAFDRPCEHEQRVTKLENEDGPFEIQIAIKNEFSGRLFYLQIQYDFVRWSAPHQCRIVCPTIYVDQLMRTDIQEAGNGLERLIFIEISDTVKTIEELMPTSADSELLSAP